MSRRRTWRGTALATAAAVLATALAGLAPVAASAAERDGDGGTTVEVTAGPFAGLDVTVSQTRNLINQVVTVSWTGGRPTTPDVGRFGVDFLQVMQCWGDQAAGPRREQCQYGGRFGVDQRGGAFTTSRQVSYGALVDPAETYRPAPGSNAQAYVPFESVTGRTSTSGSSEFFDANTTNELPFGRTRADGTGSELFEIQTSREAPGLGCGARTATATARNCFLVVVPRGSTEVDGTPRTGTGQATELESSPLSASNWQHRVVVPLQFEPLGSTCPQVSERRTIGQELVTELITRWQPALCADGGATYGFSQVTDAFARGSVVTGADAGLAFTTRPVDPSAVPADRRLVYAPVAVQGLAVSFLVERRPRQSAPKEDQLRAGSQVLDVKLTPRLVAKLLTQSYRNAVPDDDPAVAGNPLVLGADEEFLQLNPEFRRLSYNELSDAVVVVGQSDAAELLWQYVDGDPEARAWLDGAPDPSGMTVNPAYAGLDLPMPDFPKKDAYCKAYTDDRAPLCALDRRPYAADLNDAGRSAARGDNLSRQAWDPLAQPPQWRRTGPQATGQRAVLAVTDVATADRYGLATAALRNRAGEYVRPDAAGLSAGLAAMTPSAVEGVLSPDPATSAPGAYPLTTISYAVTAPAALTPEAGRDYAALLEYAAGPGQVPGIAPGTLPAGYVPLSADLTAQTLAAARAVRETAGVPVAAAAPPQQPVTATDGLGVLGGFPTTSGSLFGTAGGSTTGTGTSGTFSTGLAPAAGAPAAAQAPTIALTSTGTTPRGPLGATRYWLPALLLLGVVAGLLGPALTRLRPGAEPAPRPLQGPVTSRS